MTAKNMASQIYNIGKEAEQSNAEVEALFSSLTGPKKLTEIEKLELQLVKLQNALRTSDDKSAIKDEIRDLEFLIETKKKAQKIDDDGEGDKTTTTKEQQLADIETWLARKQNLLKEDRNKNIIDEKEYNARLQQLTIDSIKKKLNVAGQEQKEYLKLHGDLLDAEYKQLTEKDKETLLALQTSRDEQFKTIEELKNKELETLSETETNREILSLRTAEIEQNAADMRLLVLKTYKTDVENEEFEIANVKEKAATDAGTAVLNAETETAKKRLALQKQLAKMEADFFKTYNVKSWAERKQDAINQLDATYQVLKTKYKDNQEMLQKLEESYQQQLNGINVAFDDEKLKARFEANLLTTQQQYDYELDQLKKHLAEMEATEEESARKIAELKVKYMQKTTSDAQEIAGQMMSLWNGYNKVLANKEQKSYNEYADQQEKKKEKLQEELDAGLITQEHYNKEVERIDQELADKETEMKRKQFEREKKAAITQALINMAFGIAEIWAKNSSNFISMAMAAILTGLLVANTGMQIAAIESQPNPYYAGGFTEKGGKYEPAGTVHKGEFVATKEAVENPTVRPLLETIDYLQRTGQIQRVDLGSIIETKNVQQRYATGGFVDRKLRNVVSKSDTININNDNSNVNKVLQEVSVAIASLTQQMNKGIEARVLANDEYIRTTRKANKEFEKKLKMNV